MAESKNITSLAQLAKLVGKSAPAVQKWVRHAEWPFGNGPWPMKRLDEITHWADVTLRKNPEPGTTLADSGGGGGGTLSDVRRLKVMREAKLLGMKIQTQKEVVHDVASCRQQQIELMNNMKLSLTRHTPFLMVSKVRERERNVGRPLSDLEFAEIARATIEAEITQHLANGPTAPGV